MLKKLLHLYNDGHNPFPHMKGDGLHLIGGEYEYDDNPADHNVYDSGFITGNYEPEGDNKFKITDEYGNIIDVDRKAPIEAPDYYEKLTSQVDYALEDDDDRFGNEEDEDDEVLENINVELNTLKELRFNIIGELKSNEIEEKMISIEKKLTQLENERFDIEKEMNKLASIEIKKYQARPGDVEDKIGRHVLFHKVADKVINSLLEIDNEKKLDMKTIYVELEKYAKMLKVDTDDFMDTVAGHFLRNSRSPNLDIEVKKAMKLMSSLILIAKSDLSSKYDELKSMENKVGLEKNKLIKEYNEIKKMKMVDKTIEFKVDEFQKEYAERKKVLDHRKRLKEIKELYKTNPEQAAKDALELNAELKEKEALAQGKQLSKAAQKKANAAAKKALAEKHAEAPVVNAQAAIKSTGTYGKKLETFFTGGGQPILQKFTGDSSKIHDIEKQEIIPDEIVTFDDKTENSLRKACTLDLYNDKFVFEIKNYLNISFYDDKVAIPMQPSKFAGTKYFTPTYLEDGSLYKLNLKYDSPITGIQHRQNILPDTSYGRELIFIIRLKEGLYYYRPFKDTENNTLIPNGEFASGKRPLYFFESTKLKKCKDFKGNPAFNLRGHLTPI
jgi:hypothetical protein